MTRFGAIDVAIVVSTRLQPVVRIFGLQSRRGSDVSRLSHRERAVGSAKKMLMVRLAAFGCVVLWGCGSPSLGGESSSGSGGSGAVVETSTMEDVGAVGCDGNVAASPLCYRAHDVSSGFDAVVAGHFVSEHGSEAILMVSPAEIVALVGWDGAEVKETKLDGLLDLDEQSVVEAVFSADLDKDSISDELVFVVSSTKIDGPPDELAIFPVHEGGLGRSRRVSLGGNMFAPLAPYRFGNDGTVDFLAVYGDPPEPIVAIQRLRWEDGKMEPVGMPFAPPGMCGAPAAIMTGRFDSDPHRDVVLFGVCGFDRAGPVVLFGSASGEFEPYKVDTSDVGTGDLWQVGDMTGDGLDDLVFRGGGQVHVVESLGDRSFAPRATLFSDEKGFPNLAIGDVDGKLGFEVIIGSQFVDGAGELRPIVADPDVLLGFVVPSPGFDLDSNGLVDAFAGTGGDGRVLLLSGPSFGL